MLITLGIARRDHAPRQLCHDHRKGVPSQADGRRRRAVPLMGIAWGYIVVAVVRPLAALTLTSFEKCATVIIPQMRFTLGNFRNRAVAGVHRAGFRQQHDPWHSVATIGVPVIGVWAWTNFRSTMPGRVVIEYVMMIPQAVPRLVSGPDCYGRGSTFRSRSTARCGSGHLGAYSTR